MRRTMAANHQTTSCSAMLFIGVGGIGCELTARCSSAHPRWLLDFDAAALDAYEPTETMPLAGEASDTHDMDPERMRAAAEEAAQELAESVHAGTELVFIVGALGGQTGAVVLPTLADELKTTQCTVVVLGIEPLPFEGVARADLAARALGELENAADLVLTVPNRPLADLCDPALPVGKALERLKQRTAAALAQLVDALTCRSCVGLQPSELRRSLTDAGRGAFGVGVGRGERRVEKAIRDACAHSFLTQESCHQASAAILHLRGGPDLTLQEVHCATDLVAQLVGRVPIQVGLSSDAEPSGEVRATLLVAGLREPSANGAADGSLASLGTNQNLSFHDGVDLDVPAYLRRRPAPRLGY
jgi:cell division protein FtsZ